MGGEEWTEKQVIPSQVCHSAYAISVSRMEVCFSETR